MLELPRPTEPEVLYKTMRVDLYGQTPEGPKLVEVNVDPIGPPASTLEGFGVHIALHPTVWNGVEFVVEGEPPADARLLPWLAEWIDIDDRRYVEGADFQGVIHCLS